MRAGSAAALVSLLSLVLAASCGDGETEERTARDRGERLFRSARTSGNALNVFACAHCHSIGGPTDAILPGGSLAGVIGRPTFWGGADTDLLRAVDHCLRKFMLDPDGLSREQPRAADLYEYLASLPGPADPVPFTVVISVEAPPPGDAARGGETYRRACTICHGEPHSGRGKASAAALIPEETEEEHADLTRAERRRIVVEKVRHGGFLGYGGQMPPFSREVLTDAEIADVIAFLGMGE
jgi:thiosulfate dehydrogenase